MLKPLGIESKISAKIQFSNIEFSLNGRYDRLDNTDGNLELIAAAYLGSGFAVA
jgi:hypothetical protein